MRRQCGVYAGFPRGLTRTSPFDAGLVRDAVNKSQGHPLLRNSAMGKLRYPYRCLGEDSSGRTALHAAPWIFDRVSQHGM